MTPKLMRAGSELHKKKVGGGDEIMTLVIFFQYSPPLMFLKILTVVSNILTEHLTECPVSRYFVALWEIGTDGVQMLTPSLP